MDPELQRSDSPVAGDLLANMGYVIAYRTIGWVECMIRSENERWLGTGGDQTEAFENALHTLLPSKASRIAFAESVRAFAQSLGPETNPSHPPITAENGATEASSQDIAIADTAGPFGYEARVEQRADVPLPNPVPDDAVGTPSPPTTLEAQEPASAPLAPPPPPPQPAPPPVEHLGSTAAHAELDALQRAIQENYEEASLLSPQRQRLLITQWMARARAIETAALPEPNLQERVYGIAQDLGKLSKIWWPGSVQVLAKANTPSSCRRDLDSDFAEDIRTWRDVEAAATICLDRLEDTARAQGLDDLGWGDAVSLDPSPRNPTAILNDVRSKLELKTSPALLAPHQAVHTEFLKPSLLEGNPTSPINWADVAARVRWLRGCTPDVQLWGAAMGRLRWLAEVDKKIGPAIRSVLDPQFRPLGSWMKHLGIDKLERRRHRSDVVRRTPQTGSTGNAVSQWLKEAFEFGDDLPNERIAKLLQEVTEQTLSISENELPERKHRRRLKSLKSLLRGERSTPTMEAAPALEPERQPEDFAADPAPSLEAKLVERLRPHTSGRRVLFVSNRTDKIRDDKLIDLLAFRSIDACLHEPARIDSKAQAIARGSYDIVLAATGFLPHTVDGALKEACRLAGIPYIRVNRGRPLQCLLRISSELGIDRQAVP